VAQPSAQRSAGSRAEVWVYGAGNDSEGLQLTGALSVSLHLESLLCRCAFDATSAPASRFPGVRFRFLQWERHQQGG